MIIRQFTYDNPKINKILVDRDNSFLWIAFEQDSDGICHLKKVLADDISVVFYDLELEVSEIKDLKNDSFGYIYVLYTDDTNFLTKYNTFDPFNDYYDFPRETVLEEPIEISVFDGSVYFLLPGELSGTNAQILVFDDSGNYDEMIDLIISGSVVNNAISITNDGADLWVVTNETPSNLVRVFIDGGWTFAITELG